ncbi:MFS transporter [Rothia sp. HC945]|uniref:MFS transporter n=1 Tax=Rothia sp. HC945 TaxID=3171170 RepID=UPI003F276541
MKTSKMDNSRSMRNRVVAASVIGTAMEWYDFLLFGTAAAVVFGHVFFPSGDPAAGVLQSLATFAVGFFARPFGGIIFSHLGDKIGRKPVLTATVILMGAASTLMGLIPSYATIGVAAPILLVLLRILQGLGAGAELAGASLMAAEYAPKSRRGFFTALPNAGNGLGAAGAAIVLTPFTFLPQEAFLAWGWRVPFLFSSVLVVVGLYFRAKLTETPVYVRNVEEQESQARAPIVEVFKTEPKTVIRGLLLSIGPNVATYVPSVYLLTYITDNLGLAASIGTIGLLIANVIKLATIPLAGYLSDRFGRQRIFIAGATLTVLAAFPMFWLLDTKNTIAIWFAIVLVLTFALDLMLGSQQSMLAEMFQTNVRYTGMAFSREVASAAIGGTLPFIFAWLSNLTSGTWALSVVMIVLCVIAIVGVVGTPDRRDMDFVDPQKCKPDGVLEAD